MCVGAARLGYRSAWVAEVAGPEAFALAGAIATATDLDLGVAVVAADTRTPALLAMGAATVSQLAGGRPFALGIGSSSQVIVEGWHGRRFHPPLGRTRETVLAVRALLAGERSFSGRYLSATGFRLATPPAGPVPIYVGALGRRMLRLAGAVADGVCLNLMPPQMVARQLAEIRAGAAEAERSLPPDFGVMARLHVVLDDDLAAARDVVRSAFGPYFAQPVYNRFLTWCGYPEAAAAIASGFAAGDRQAVAAAMSDDLVDAVALVGPVGRIAARLDEYAAAGIAEAALNVLASSPGEVLQVLEGLAP